MEFYKVVLKGIVQGVGFRPFIYNLAKEFGAKGWIQNTAEGVEIDIAIPDIEMFLDRLKKELPPLSRIDNISVITIEPFEAQEFSIHTTYRQTTAKTLLLPDMAICQACKDEMQDPTSKRYKYPFINCTNCGVRYSIIKNLPYDRKHTAMAPFRMCVSCQKEYEDPTSRMFHAQPIGCNECGVHTFLHVNGTTITDDAIQKTAQLLQEGKIGAIKGVGGFHLVCDATNEKVLQKLRTYKQRPTKPFALMCKDMAMLKEFAEVSPKEEQVLSSSQAPIVLLQKAKDYHLAPSVAPHIHYIGAMIAATPLHLLLFESLQNPIVATSANISGEPLCITKEEIEQKLPFVDFVLDYDREIINAIDDSVVMVVDEDVIVLRLARGYAPFALSLPQPLKKPLLALGANQKASFALAFENNLLLSPYIADLDTIESIEHYKRTLQNFERLYGFSYHKVVCDKHSGYETTKIAPSFGVPILQVQHHKAHLASVKAEYGLCDDGYVGCIFDGTGLGDDGSLWGGEIFVRSHRKYHFKPLVLLGGEKAVRESRRVALAKLFEHYSFDEVCEFDLEVVQSFSTTELKTLHSMYEKQINTITSSSVGRMFDMVASFAGLVQIQSYEGESGLLCEAAYNFTCKESFNFTIEDGVIEIEFDLFDKELVSKFINTLGKIIIFVAEKEKLPVILSGGVFQNKILLGLVKKQANKKSIKVYHNKQVPINDSGISVGQIWEVLYG